MGRREEQFEVQLGILTLFLSQISARKKPVQVLAQLDLLSRGASSTSRAQPHHANPSFALSEHFLTKSEGSQSLGSVAAWGLVVVVSNALSQVTAASIR